MPPQPHARVVGIFFPVFTVAQVIKVFLGSFAGANGFFDVIFVALNQQKAAAAGAGVVEAVSRVFLFTTNAAVPKVQLLHSEYYKPSPKPHPRKIPKKGL